MLYRRIFIKLKNLFAKKDKKIFFLYGLRTPLDQKGSFISELNPYTLLEDLTDHVLRNTEISFRHIKNIFSLFQENSYNSSQFVFKLRKSLKLPRSVEGLSLNTQTLSSAQALIFALKSNESKEKSAFLITGISHPCNLEKAYKLPMTTAKKNILHDFYLKKGKENFLLKNSTCPEKILKSFKKNIIDFKISSKEQVEYIKKTYENYRTNLESVGDQDEIHPAYWNLRNEQVLSEDLLNLNQVDFEEDKNSLEYELLSSSFSQKTYGGVCCLFASSDLADQVDVKNKIKILDTYTVGFDPKKELIYGPLLSLIPLLDKNKLSLSDIALLEIHEQFAGQMVLCLRMLNSPELLKKYFSSKQNKKVTSETYLNSSGGALTYGDLPGLNSLKIFITIAKKLYLQKKKYALVCESSYYGSSSSFLLERVDQ